MVCTWYVLCTYWYILTKTKMQTCITLGIEPRISCIASSALYHYATRVHALVVLVVNTSDIATGNYTGVARYLLDVWRGSRSAPGSSHDVTGSGLD
jgi:hypothetical protein